MIYSDEQLKYIAETVQDNTIKATTELFNAKFGTSQSYKAIGSIMKTYGIKTGRDGKFQKGSIPANKGKKGICYEGCKATQFKPGNKPNNTRKLGEEKIDKDGYVYVKVSEDKVPSRFNWKQKHRLIWESIYGEIPKNYQVMFADQDKTNFNPSNLILVTAAEKAVMSKNGLFYKDAESTKVGLSIAKLMLKISSRKKKG